MPKEDDLNAEMNIEVDTHDELLEFLKNTDISVPERGEKRKTEHTEIWSICRLLATLEKGCFSYPLKIKYIDKPDFRLHEINGNQHSFGIEFTEAIPEDYAKALVMRNKEYPDAIVDMSLFKWGMKKKTTQEIRDILKESTKRLTGPGWVGDKPEKEWAKAIEETVGSKTEKLNKNGFEKLDHNWLLIYDNLPLPNPDIDEAISFLRQPILHYWKSENPSHRFETVFVETGRQIICMEESGFVEKPINDLWVDN